MHHGSRVDEYFVKLADLRSIGVLMVDPKGDIQYVSDCARRLLQCGESATIEDCLSPVAEQIRQALDRHRKSGETRTDDHRLGIGADGDRDIAIVIHTVEVESCQGHLIVLHDPDREDLEDRELRLASRMRNLGRVYEAMAHDLRTPLASMLLHLKLVADQVRRWSDREGREGVFRSVEVVRDSVRLIDRSLSQLLGELVPTDSARMRYDLSELVFSVMQLMRPLASRSRVAVSLEIPDRVILVDGHPDRIKHAIMNLISNAIEAMKDGGTLEITLDTHKGDATLSIADNGGGIPSDVQDTLFDRYRTTKPGGTGLGLHSARQSVRADGGEVTFTTGAEGTTFTIRLPGMDAGEPERG